LSYEQKDKNTIRSIEPEEAILLKNNSTGIATFFEAIPFENEMIQIYVGKRRLASSLLTLKKISDI